MLTFQLPPFLYLTDVHNVKNYTHFEQNVFFGINIEPKEIFSSANSLQSIQKFFDTIHFISKMDQYAVSLCRENANISFSNSGIEYGIILPIDVLHIENKTDQTEIILRPTISTVSISKFGLFISVKIDMNFDQILSALLPLCGIAAGNGTDQNF